jgi:hypothetical protein
VGTAAHVTMSEPFDRALRAAARRGRTGGVCPDAGLLAAYADGRLPSDERRQVEAHAADCPSCVRHLALLGAVAEAPEPAPARGWLSRWGWMVPVATTALVFAVWTSLPDDATQRAITVPHRQDAPPVMADPGQPGQSPRDDRASAPAGDDVTGRDGGPASDDSARARQTPGTPVAPPRETQFAEPMAELPLRPEPEQRLEASRAPLPAPSAAPEFAAAEVPSPPPAPPPPPMAPVPSPPAHAVASDAAGGAPAKSTEAVRVAPGTEPGGRAETATRQADSLLHRVAGAGALEFVVETAWGDRYRTAAGRIERSRDRGATWRAIGALPDRTLTVASCVALARTCWAGGVEGTMLRIEGDDARRADLPLRARVESLVVTPEGAVTVTVEGGTRFLSTDDGRTWQRQAP